MSYPALHSIRGNLIMKKNDILQKGNKSQYYNNRVEIIAKLNAIEYKINAIDRYIKTNYPEEMLDYLYPKRERKK